MSLQLRDPSIETTDQLMMEFELCIGLIFKPLRHHSQSLKENGSSLPSIWQSVLVVLEDLLSDKESASPLPEERREHIPESLKKTMDSLANEHLQNAIMVLLSTGVLFADSKAPGDLTAITWESVSRMGVSDGAVQEWKQQATIDSNSSQPEVDITTEPPAEQQAENEALRT